tara:strand:- start:1174 stop:1335 length:162 start_codon:yes stop_codon:yes gene_type:complete
VAIVGRLRNKELREDINSGKETLTVRTELSKSKDGKDMYLLADAPIESTQGKL